MPDNKNKQQNPNQNKQQQNQNQNKQQPAVENEGNRQQSGNREIEKDVDTDETDGGDAAETDEQGEVTQRNPRTSDDQSKR
jgi:hypothetical protein